MAGTKNKNTEAKNTNAAKITKNKNGGTKLTDMKPIKLTREEFDSKSPEELVALLTKPENRLSSERSKADLVKRIEEGRVNSLSAGIMMAYTFNSLRVKDVEPLVKGGFKPESAKVKMTQAEFDKLTPKGKADLIEKYSHKKRVASAIYPELVAKGMPMTAEDVVYVTNGRVAIEGVTVASVNVKQPVPTDGVQFS
jgi:hypothetical protein